MMLQRRRMSKPAFAAAALTSSGVAHQDGGQEAVPDSSRAVASRIRGSAPSVKTIGAGIGLQSFDQFYEHVSLPPKS